MRYNKIAETVSPVSELCFGTLALSQLQRPLDPERGAEVLSYALGRGINFLDTAQYYDNYELCRRAMELSGKYDAVISTKTYAYDRDGAAAAVEEARRRLNRDVIDIFMLHEQESIHTLHGHREALFYLFECRERGIIRAVGASTHRISLVKAVRELAGEGIQLDVLHPIFNREGIGIGDGDAAQMYAACRALGEDGVGIFAMKVLGGGHLWRDPGSAFDYALDAPFVSSVAVGMQSEDEVDCNISYFESRTFPDISKKSVNSHERRLYVEDYCLGCGKCAERCAQGAIAVDGAAVVDHSKCVLCGYCVKACPEFALKVL